MEIVLKDIKSKYSEIFSLGDLDNIHQTFKKFSSMKGPLEAKLFVINESISSNQLSKLKNHFYKIHICSLCIYSNNRDTVLAGKSLRIDSTFFKEQELKNKLRLLNSNKKDDVLHEGTLRSGDRLSSNGNLCIIGDVNPGAIVSAKKNIYVWGKLLGIAFAGKGGNKNASIASLYLNPLQLRIADVIAIGPKDKPKNHYPEIAVVDKQTIIIKPLVIETRN
ncbi:MULTISPECIES: septum site-determining protein MinC [Prochlorococcus]|uniref:Septum site-determining protein MinC n=1 Tax=Prochlorococcus marinus str. MIT 9116 TaxID=167544 RepID=A0A0A1ZNW5_PROMR|nr:septum site-determining protein MinC [Prochlorococcus marinus]KGF90262.1 Septum site-determining protein MinC [Prochlorococcus marinus str. MIT 9107]KGF91287.1 Septum site-determining protein MinC [Prochlorococcus marinus str. MIT 9116]KGF94799.1 Septum site-determining protein MinC [Prochlorococcus marinus str. MIT 9123]